MTAPPTFTEDDYATAAFSAQQRGMTDEWADTIAGSVADLIGHYWSDSDGDEATLAELVTEAIYAEESAMPDTIYTHGIVADFNETGAILAVEDLLDEGILPSDINECVTGDGLTGWQAFMVYAAVLTVQQSALMALSHLVALIDFDSEAGR